MTQIKRWLWIAAGTVALILAIAGVVLPLLPTTPFVILAAACFARGSKRFHQAMLNHRTFGPVIAQWQSRRSIARSVKRKAYVLMALSFSLSLALLHGRPLHQAGLIAIGLGLAWWLSRVPEH
jgi:uncharacterized membrane protein YbaN (DUF454 family)